MRQKTPDQGVAIAFGIVWALAAISFLIFSATSYKTDVPTPRFKPEMP